MNDQDKNFMPTIFEHEEVRVMEALKARGYRYVFQITLLYGEGKRRNFGEALAVKSAAQVGPLLRSFPEHQQAKLSWSKPIDEYISSLKERV